MAIFDKISGIAKTVGDKTGEIAKSVGDKTSGMIEITKLKTKIKAENDDIIERQQKIGALCWSKYFEGASFDDDINEQLESIKAGFERINGLQEEIEAINKAGQAANGLVCTSCGTVNPLGTKFCSSCGSKIEAPVPSGKICSNCGTSNTGNTKFCVQCGTNIESAGTKPCPYCGTELDIGSKFCGSCGQKIE